MLRDFSKLWAGVGALLVSLTAPPEAAAARPFYVGLRYEVEGAERCWDAAEFTRSVARGVGYDPFRSTDGLRVSVHVRSTASALEGSVIWTDPRGARIGERRFVARDRDCAKLLREISFAVALQIDLLRPASDDEPSADAASSAPSSAKGSPQASAPSAPSASGSAQPARRSAAEPRSNRGALDGGAPNAHANAAARTLRFSIGAGPSLAWRAAPRLTGQGRVFADARHGELSFELGAEATLPVEERLDDGSGFRQSLAGASAAACAHRQAFGACAVGRLTRLSVTGLGVDAPRSPDALVAQAGARVTALWDLSDTWWLSPHIDALGLLTPREVTVNQTTAWEMPVLSVSVGLDVAARL